MTVRYYNLRETKKRKDDTGYILSVNTENKGKKIKSSTGFIDKERYKIDFLRKQGDNEIYGLIDLRLGYYTESKTSCGLNVGSGYIGLTPKGNSIKLELMLSSEGELKISKKPKRKKYYLEEVSKKYAEECKSDRTEYEMLWAYILD